MKSLVLSTALNDETVVAYLSCFRISKGSGRVLHEVGLGPKIRVVIKPALLHLLTSEKAGLFPQGFLLAVSALEGVDVAEELFGIRLGDVPRWIAKHRIETCSFGAEDIR